MRSWRKLIPLMLGVDMYAKAVQGMAPEEAVAWADGELRKVYA